MADDPKSYQAVAVSSTFTDLQAHRREVGDALARFDLFPKMMEFDGARADADVIESSLGLVRDSSAFIGIISHKYGQTPACPDRNPEGLSISELEFDEAMKLGRPILLFVMADDHPVTMADVEQDSNKLDKLNAFKTRAKKMRNGLEVNRIYETFDSVDDFSKKSAIAVGRLNKLLQHKPVAVTPSQKADTPDEQRLSNPPELHAVPRYMGSHKFVGRASELQILDEWAGEADPDPMLLFEAIGGSGKSMLTWEWITKHAVVARKTWTGRFWYSFYERGAQLTDFCREALAYTSGQPLETFKKMRIHELSERLIAELERQPWLLVLDGLERVLVAYHRIDAAQLRDEEADTVGDQIGKRDPCAAIRPEDDDLLQQLALVKPSKILVTSRLTPRALINRSNTSIPGVRRELLSGLKPSDAETLMRSSGIRGASSVMRDYVQKNCGCHPLVIGVLAGLVNEHMPDRGNFDAWLDAPDDGRALNFADLDLVGKREHILEAAIRALSPEALQLLQTLSLLQRGANYELLSTLNPYLPPEMNSGDDKSNPETRIAAKLLSETIRDLERRGLLQYDHSEQRYDLHPVVRGVAAGRMSKEEREARGGQVVNYFISQNPAAWDDVDSLEDLASSLQLVATLTQIGRFEAAFNLYRGGLSNALLFNCQADVEAQALLRPFFPNGWDGEIVLFDGEEQSILLNCAALALNALAPLQALRLHERALCSDIACAGRAGDISGLLRNLTMHFINLGKLAVTERILILALDFAKAAHDTKQEFASMLELFNFSSFLGNHHRTLELWARLNRMGRNWPRNLYRLGSAEANFAWACHRQDELNEKIIEEAEIWAGKGHNRQALRELAQLRGEFHLQRREKRSAVDSLVRAVRMAREVGQQCIAAEALLVIARLRAGESFETCTEAERLSGAQDRDQVYIAELWRELGDPGRAVSAARRAHDWAIADGEPYVFRYELNRSRALLEELGAELPEIPEYTPASDPPFQWESDVRMMIEELKSKHAKGDEVLNSSLP